MLKLINTSATVVIFVITVVFAVSTWLAHERTPDITIVVTSWPVSQLAHAAQSLGFFEAEGVNVKVVDMGRDTALATKALSEGKADGGLLALSEPVALEFAGDKMRIVASIDYSSGANGLVASGDVQSIADLKGRKVAYQPDSIDELLLLVALQRSEMKLSDIITVPANQFNSVQSFLAGEVDAVVAAHPLLSLAVTQPQGHLLFSSDEAPWLISDVVVFRQEFIAGHSKELSAFLSGWFNMIDKLQTSPTARSEILAVVAMSSGVSLSEVEQEFSGIKVLNFVDNAVALTYGKDEMSLYWSVRRYIDFLESKKGLPYYDDAVTLIDPTFIRRGLRN